MVYYVSRLGLKLKGFCTFGTLPTTVEKFLAMSSYTKIQLLTRKVAVGGELGFLDACLDAINDEYRKSIIDVKLEIKAKYMQELLDWNIQKLEKTKWWIGFGKGCDKLESQSEKHTQMQTEIQKHELGMDLIGLFLKINVFVLSLVNEKTLDILSRSTIFNPEWDTIVILNWIGKGYEILFKSCDSNATKELQKQQFLFTKKEDNGVVDFLNTTFEQNNRDAQLLKQSYIAIGKITKSLQKQVIAQVLNIENKIIGFIINDNEWFCPAIESPPVPLLPVRQFYKSSEANYSIELLKRMSLMYPEYKVVKQITNSDGYVVGLALDNGTICPLKVDPSFVISDIKKEDYKLTPYIENVTHFLIEKNEDKNSARHFREETKNSRKNMNKMFMLFLIEFHKVLSR